MSHQVSEKVKPQKDTTTHVLEWLKIKEENQILPSVDKDMDQPELTYIADLNANWYTYTGKWFGNFLGNKHVQTT